MIDALIEAGRDFHARGWMLATAGNLSARVASDPLRYAITASGGHKGRLQPSDFITLGLGLSDPDRPARPSAETVVHDALYAQRAPGAILHVHGPHITLVARHWLGAGGVDVSGFEYVKALGFWEPGARVVLPIVPNHDDIPRLADAVAAAAGNAPAVLVASHGVYAWGDSVADAVRHIEATEFLCTMVWLELSAGLRERPAP